MIKVRKTTINLVCGILIGMFISGVSDTISDPRKTETTPLPTMATTVSVPIVDEQIDDPLGAEIASGLQIIQVPPPLDVNGLHPYQCYFNGEPVNIPKEVVDKILIGRTDPKNQAPDFNIHDFTGNLKMVRGRTRSVSGE
jgi:hypothetical protein